jgi:hypothetical protein
MARLQQPDPPVHLSAGGVPAMCCRVFGGVRKRESSCCG